MLSRELLDEIVHDPWFASMNRPYLVIDTDLRIRAANLAYQQVTGHPERVMADERLFDVFPGNPEDPEADGVARLSASLETVFSTRRRHWMGLQRYDVRDLLEPDRFLPKVWVPVNTPIRQEGDTVAVLHHVEDVTSLVGTSLGGPGVGHPGDPRVDWEELHGSARELSRLFPGLAHDAVVGIVAHSHRTVRDATGSVDREKAIQLARVRLELLAGHLAQDEVDQPISRP